MARGTKRGAEASREEAPTVAARGGKRAKATGEGEGLRVALETVVRTGKRAKRGGG
ncbi:hypothetical protein ACLESD_05705 [Pyxidicoccus sp. 3LFB2]